MLLEGCQTMRGHAWSNNTREVVVRASQFGLGPTVIKAITGVSERSIQRILSEPEHGDDHHQRRRRKKVLDVEHHRIR